MKKYIVLALLAGFCTTATAAELIFVSDSPKAQAARQKVSLDISTDDAETAAAHFRVQFKGDVKAIDTSRCLSELPKSHQGLCEANPKNGRVSVVVWSVDNTPLPQGIVSLGQLVVDYAGNSAKLDRGVIVDRAQVASVSGAETPLTVTNDGASGDQFGRRAER